MPIQKRIDYQGENIDGTTRGRGRQPPATRSCVAPGLPCNLRFVSRRDLKTHAERLLATLSQQETDSVRTTPYIQHAIARYFERGMVGENVQLYRSITNVDENQWNNVVENASVGSVFHRYGWLLAIERGLSVEPFHIVYEKNSNPVGVFPNFVTRLFETPFASLQSLPVGYGGPVILTDERTVFPSMLETIAEEFGGRLLFHEIHSYDPEYSKFGRLLSDFRFRSSLRECRFVLDLDTDWETILTNMRSGRRRNVKKATSQRYEVRHVEPDDRITAFHGSYRRALDETEGEPYPLSFFEAFCDTLGERVLLLQAIVEDRVVGSHIYFINEEQSSLVYYFSAVEERNYEYYPAELLHQRAIQWAIERDFDRYDFGGSAADIEDGVFRYKSQYGGDIVPALTWRGGYSWVRDRILDVGSSFHRLVEN